MPGKPELTAIYAIIGPQKRLHSVFPAADNVISPSFLRCILTVMATAPDAFIGQHEHSSGITATTCCCGAARRFPASGVGRPPSHFRYSSSPSPSLRRKRDSLVPLGASLTDTQSARRRIPRSLGS
jgi:hypothetical protein